jgi:hypothetical protein
MITANTTPVPAPLGLHGNQTDAAYLIMHGPAAVAGGGWNPPPALGLAGPMPPTTPRVSWTPISGPIG